MINEDTELDDSNWILMKKTEPERIQVKRQKQEGVCFQWQQSGTCSYKSGCIFQHPGPEQMKIIKEQEETKARGFGGQFRGQKPMFQNTSKEICKYYLKGICNQGESCRFSHDVKNNDKLIYSESSSHKKKFFGEVKQLSSKLIKPNEFQIPLIENHKNDTFEIDNFSISLHPAVTIMPEHDLILIRHGLSQYNYSSSRFYYETGFDHQTEEARAYMLCDLLMDTLLNPYGVQQAKNQQDQINKIDFDTVFVSPMRRTIQTCINLFQNHPNLKSIKFIIQPICSEVLSKICDISIFNAADLQKYCSNFQNFNFDTSLLKGQQKYKDFWQIENINKEFVKQELFNRYNSRKEGEKLTHVLKTKMSQVFPQPIEQYKSVHVRASQMKADLKNYINQNKKQLAGKKIGIVSHSTFFQNFTAKELSSDGKVIGALNLDNCEIISFKI